MKNKIILFIVVLLIAGAAQAATEAEKRAAIDAGLAYLATTQNADGSFDGGGTDYLLAQTGSSVLAFLEEKPNWGANAAAYQIVVDKGIDYILSKGSIVNIGPQTWGNPDGDGDGIGVKLYPGGVNSRDTYVTGICLPAIAASGTPNKLVTSGPLTGMTYKQVVQDVIDYFAFGQNDSGTPEGGWRYWANYGSSDQSTTQWPVIAGEYASLMGVSYPAFVSTELAKWTSYIQNADGGAGYTSPTYRYGEMNETGALLIVQDFLGWDGGTATEQAKVQAALNFINQNWQWALGAGGSFDGNIGNPYAMWAIYKGLQLTIGLDDTTTITNLMYADPGDVELAHGYNWWEEYCEWLVNNQNGSGSWNGYAYWGSALATPWYINILAATVIPDHKIPVPGAFLLGSIGLAFACQKLRSRKEL
jgi:hypothetical protein